LKARPHITIPSPLICANITGRGLERVVPVVVPVGGQVELRIEVDSTILSGCTSESESTEYEVKQAIVEHVRGMLFEVCSFIVAVLAGSSRRYGVILTD